MNFFNYLIFVLVVIAGISISYKIRYHRNAKNIMNEPPILFSINKFLSLNYLFPLRQRPNNAFDNKLRTKANIALLIFYVSFILGLIFSVFAN